MKLAVVTGATGFTGPFVVRALRDRFPELPIRCVVRPTSQTDAIRLPGVTTAIADLRDGPALEAAFAGADTLVNVASLGFDWTDTVVQAAQRTGIGRGVFIGTTAMLTTLAVSSKAVRERGEALVKASGMAWTILRPTMIYGTPADRNIARLIRFIERSPVVPLVGGAALQQPVHVADVAWAVAAALAEPATIGRVYSISGRDAMPLETLVRQVMQAAGRRRLFVHVPVTPLILALSAVSRVRRPPVSVEQVRRLSENKNFSHAEAAADFGYSPRDFMTGVKAEIDLMRSAS